MLQGEVDPVIIYGCGINGIHLYYRIRNNCNIIAFADRSEIKQGYVLDGLRCISIDELMSLDRNIKIIVSIEHPEEAVCDLTELGFDNVLRLSDIDCKKESFNNDFAGIEYLSELKNMLEIGLAHTDNDNVSISDADILEIVNDYKKRNINEHCRD